jgi:hypothetical protein
MSTRPCIQCGRPILLVKDSYGKVVALDVESRKHVWEVSAASVELVASKVDSPEIYLDHACICECNASVRRGVA